MKLSKILTLMISVFMASTAIANTVYIQYNPSCMERFEYRLNKDYSTNPYVAYRFKLNDQETIIFEVGQETASGSKYFPGDTKSCGELSLDDGLVQDINNGDAQIYIVTKNQYGQTTFVSPVRVASYVNKTPYELVYETNDFGFAYNYSQTLSKDINLATQGSGTEVFFRGIENSCPKKYIFRKVSYVYENPFTDFVVVPDLGITYVKTIQDDESSDFGQSQLAKIDDQSLEDYLGSICRGIDPSKRLSKPNGNLMAGNNGNNNAGNTTGNTNNNGTASNGTNPTTNNGTTFNSICSNIYKDVDKGIYIDRSTNLPAEGQCGGQVYRNGIASTGSTITSTSTSTTPTTNFTHQVYKDVNRGIYIDRNTGQAANGDFGGLTYINGYLRGEQPTNTVVTDTYTPPTTTTTSCGIYKDLDRGLYIDRNTGQPANRSCGGQTYRNGYMANGNPIAVNTNTSVPNTTTTTPVTTTTTTTRPQTSSNICGITAAYGFHVVQENETLYSLARTYNVTVNDLKKWNKLSNKHLIKTCMQLRIQAVKPSGPAPDPVLVSKGFDNSEVHIVKAGENLYQISKRYGYTPEKIMHMNGLTSATIKPGQKLRTKDCNCPADSQVSHNGISNFEEGTERLVSKGTEDVEFYTNTKRKVHIVKDGDTLYSIAKRYNTTEENIRTWNELGDTELIIPAQRLIVQ